MRRLGAITETTCASPAYLARHGVPRSWRALDGHVMVGFISSRTGEVMPLEFVVKGKTRLVHLPARVTVNNSDTFTDLARHGYGLIQVPRYRLTHDLAAGTLVEVLTETPPSPTPVSVFYPQNRHTSPRLRVFIDWVSDIFASAAL
jgi:DNA-binding transcriptional LysR family regulator